MEIAVVGPLEFTLGFQLAGVKNLYNPSDEEEMSETLISLLKQSEIGVVVVDNIDLMKLPERLRIRLSESVTPTVLGVGTEEDNTLRESIKSALGVDLWK
jgi:V/A-type H+-transporting ATPase subunit F|tara:strand:+ start:289 stop:588 length:300 start_codon:yes stop_codon:yes gene_type:complete